jgi:sugar phosphate isomerase/epimerase
MMNISMWTGYFMDLVPAPEDGVREMLAGGFRFGELSFEDAELLLERGDPEATGLAFRSFLSDVGFQMPQGHIHLSFEITKDQAELDAIKRWLDLFLGIGIRSAVLHCSRLCDACREERVERNAAALRQLTSHLRGTELCLCLENLGGHLGAAGDLKEIIAAAGGQNLGICLDTGHLNWTQNAQSPGAFIREAGSWLKALHINDNEGATDQHLLPLGRGTIDWAETMAALKEIGYKDLFNYEIPGERRATPLGAMRLKLKYAYALAEFMLAM